MQRFIQIFLAALLLGISPAVNATSNAPGATAVMFPPDMASCDFTGGTKFDVLMWNGQTNVYCLPIPSCGLMQVLVFDQTSYKFSCYPSGIQGVPLAPLPSQYGPAQATMIPGVYQPPITAAEGPSAPVVPLLPSGITASGPPTTPINTTGYQPPISPLGNTTTNSSGGP